ETGREEPWPATALVIDALLGTGAAGPARGDVLALAQRLVAYGAPVLAIDGPTGLDLSSGEVHGPVRAELSVTFGGPRRGHLLAREWCGKIVVVDIGLPPADPVWPVLVTDGWAGARLPKLTPTMHKGDRGRVTVVGGAHGMTGAAPRRVPARRRRASSGPGRARRRRPRPAARWRGATGGALAAPGRVPRPVRRRARRQGGDRPLGRIREGRAEGEGHRAAEG